MTTRLALSLVLGAALLAAAPDLAAQRTIAPGQTVSGRLDTSDPKLDDDSYYDEYTYAGRPGEQIVITMRSSDFDTYLNWGRRSGSAFVSEQTDDDGAGGTDSEVRVTVGSGGTYLIRANSLEGGATGAYTISVARVSGGVATRPQPGTRAEPGARGGTIEAGQTVSGRLETSDARLGDGSYYDDYTYRGRPGEEIVIVLRSSDFDTYLSWGPGSGGSFRSETTDDDGGGGTDSQVRVRVGSGGTYTVRANSLEAGKTGSYTLTVQPAGGARQAGAAGGTIRAGEMVEARLEPSDPKLPDNSHYDTYTYQGSPGEQIVVTLTSGDFDAYLRGGRMQGGQFVLVDQDDDGAGGTNARFQATVGPSGTYVIQANSLRAATTGSYTLRVDAAGRGAPAGAQTIAMGQTVSGRITAQDPVMSDNSHYKLYVYRGTPGERVLVTMRSSDFDAYMSWGRLSGSDFEAEESDDDSGGGTNAQIVATVGSSGTYAIRANTLRAGETGAFTLSVEPVSAAAQRAPEVPAGAATVRAGQTVTGRLTRSSSMLSDSSFYDQYVYSGRPGDRLQITLRSSDFDVYLRWGQVSGGRFQEADNDDDGAGGTDAQMTVTVGSTGVYAIQANAFKPGDTGSYTLTVQPLAATAGPVASERSGAAGKWMYAYTDAANPVFRPLAQRFKQAGMFETLAADLNQRFPLPRNVGLRAAECGQVNAFYSPRNGTVTLCYELLQHLYNVFGSGGAQQQREAVDGAVTFILMHEIGHALVHVMDLPVTGREEDAVDQLATVMLISSGEKGAQAAMNGVRAIQPGANAVFDASDFADEHSLGPQRLYNVACWIYGSDPQKYRGMVSNGLLPQARAQRCPGEYERLSKAWMRLLQEGGGR